MFFLKYNLKALHESQHLLLLLTLMSSTRCEKRNHRSKLDNKNNA